MLASDYEGISNAMLEAMALGLPVVCTDCPVGGARMFIRNGENGWLTPVGDENALASAMLRVIEQPFGQTQLDCSARRLRHDLSSVEISKMWKELL